MNFLVDSWIMVWWVMSDPVFQLRCGGQFAVEQKIGDLEEGAMLGQNFDGIAAITQDAFVAIDEGDGAVAGRGIHEGRVVGHEAEVVGAGFNFAQIHGADRAILNGQGVVLPSAIVGNYGILRHTETPEVDSRAKDRLLDAPPVGRDSSG